VVVHSYRHRYGLAPGDPQFESMEEALLKQPKIKVPTIVLDATADGVEPFEGTGKDADCFEGKYERRIIADIGHNVPQEAPTEFTNAVIFFIEH